VPQPVSLPTYLGGRSHGAEYGAHDLGGESARIRLQTGHRLLFVFFERGAGLLDLPLGVGASFRHNLVAQLGGLLAAGFLILENLLPRLAEALFVFGGAGFGGGNVSAGFFHGALGAIVALGEHGAERPMNEESIENIERYEQNNRGHGSEQ
jgi:hypothetical protein